MDHVEDGKDARSLIGLALVAALPGLRRREWGLPGGHLLGLLHEHEVVLLVESIQDLPRLQDRLGHVPVVLIIHHPLLRLGLPDCCGLGERGFDLSNGLALLLDLHPEVLCLLRQPSHEVGGVVHLARLHCRAAGVIGTLLLAVLLLSQVVNLLLLEERDHVVNGLGDLLEVAGHEGQARSERGQPGVRAGAGSLAEHLCCRARPLLGGARVGLLHAGLLQERVALGFEGAPHEVAGVVVVQDLNRFLEGCDLVRPERVPHLPLGLLLCQLILGLLDELLVIGNLQLEVVDLILRLLLVQPPCAVLDHQLVLRLLGLRLLSSLVLDELVIKRLRVSLLLAGLCKVCREGLVQLRQRPLDLEGARLVAHPEGGLLVQVLPVSALGDISGEEPAEEHGIAGGKRALPDLHRMLQGGRIRGTRSEALAHAVAGALHQERPGLVAVGGRLEDIDCLGQRCNRLLHLILRFQELPVLLRTQVC
mmetsp:Transcript_44656/g.124187  ORF Transcript_44656/g.124187 Transcript_44656/m.124187 type:complete len:478 (-) Transcript_44656:485-1918(-)